MLRIFYIKNINKSLMKCIFLYLIAIFNILLPNQIQSPINNKVIEISNDDNYSFIAAGHLYGSPTINSAFPSANILGMIDEINQMNCSFFISLGDNFRETDKIQIDNYIKSFSDKIHIPIFNAVGNHDLTNRIEYESIFGKTYYDFQYKSELYIFLDSELDAPNISELQLQYFMELINEVSQKPSIKNIFIFSHKLLWTINNPRYDIVYENVNPRTKRGYDKNSNVNHLIISLLTTIQKEKNVYWLSGDLGSNGTLPLFFDKDPLTGITYIGTGIGDTMEDLILKVDIKNSNVSFMPIRLSDNNPIEISNYGLNSWKNYFHKKESTFLMKIRFVIFHEYYLLGILTVLAPLMLTVIYRKKTLDE